MKTGNKNRVLVFVVLAAIILAFDQWTKSLCAGFEVGERMMTVIPGILDFTLVHNTGAAWGMFGNMTDVFIVIALIICVAIVVFLFFTSKATDYFTVVACAFIFAGGLGNAIDRFVNGYVVDMIAVTFIDYPVFNVADCAITIGVVLLLISVLFVNRSTYEQN